MAITSKIELITPEIAREYLTHNTDNFRKLHRPTVKVYAEAITRGRWQLNGETIVFSKDGVLKNGQHRLAAIIMANKPIETLVVRGVDNDVVIFDDLKVRTSTEKARARKIDTTTSQLSVANIIVNQFSNKRIGDSVYDYVEAHADELCRAERLVGKGGHNAPSICASYLMLRNNELPCYEIELFFRLLYDFGFTHADGYDVSSAIMAQRMIDERGKTRGGTRMIQKERLEIIIMAMKDFHKGKKVTEKYKISEPFKFMELMNKVRKEDGLIQEG